MLAPHGAAWRAVALAMFLLVVLGASVPPVAAYHVGTTKPASLHIAETVTLPMNNYSVYTFLIGSGDKLTYDVVVTSGTAIDMYIVPADGLTDYQSETALTFSLYVRSESRTTISGTFSGTSQNSGADSVIVDNVDFSGATPSGDVTVAVNLTREIARGPDLAVVGGIALVVIIIVIALVAVLAIRARRKRAAMPPPMAPPAYPGPPGTYAPPPYPQYPPPQQPPQGPYPPPPPSP